MFNKFAGYEEAFAQWRRDGMPGLKPESYAYVEFLTSMDDDQAARQGTLWPHQWEAFLRVVVPPVRGREHPREVGGRQALVAVVEQEVRPIVPIDEAVLQRRRKRRQRDQHQPHPQDHGRAQEPSAWRVALAGGRGFAGPSHEGGILRLPQRTPNADEGSRHG
jgi:hypothetical protein